MIDFCYSSPNILFCAQCMGCMVVTNIYIYLYVKPLLWPFILTIFASGSIMLKFIAHELLISHLII